MHGDEKQHIGGREGEEKDWGGVHRSFICTEMIRNKCGKFKDGQSWVADVILYIFLVLQSFCDLKNLKVPLPSSHWPGVPFLQPIFPYLVKSYNMKRSMGCLLLFSDTGALSQRVLKGKESCPQQVLFFPMWAQERITEGVNDFGRTS